MSFVPGTVGATTAGAAAAAARRRRLRQEEEQMTKYGAEEIEGWEFKIVRSATGKFKRPEVVRQLCEEEARAGWEMLEKFDDSRIRFKRRTEHRARDRQLEFDPYRTQVGIGESMLGLYVTVAILAVVGLLAGLVFLVASKS